MIHRHLAISGLPTRRKFATWRSTLVQVATAGRRTSPNEFEDRGVHSLKGIDESWQLFAVQTAR